MAKKRKITFKQFVLDYGKGPPQSCGEWDFCNDAVHDKTFKNHTKWKTLLSYLENEGASSECIRRAKNVFDRWCKLHGPFDGLGPKDIERVRKATRKAWQYSVPRRLCVERCTDEDGWANCEKCKRRMPKIYVDHIKMVGEVDDGYLRRLFCPSSQLQGLCKVCHNAKTKEERRQLAASKDFF